MRKTCVKVVSLDYPDKEDTDFVMEIKTDFKILKPCPWDKSRNSLPQDSTLVCCAYLMSESTT